MESNNVNSISIEIPNYSGPLEVLLDLAKNQKVDLTKISVTKLAILVCTEIVLLFIVNVFDIVKVVFAADVTLLKAVASAPCVFEFAFIAVANAAAVLFPDDKLDDKVAANAF